MKFIILLLLVSGLGLAGCITRSKARTQSRESFLAGQQQGIRQVEDARRINIRFLGPTQHQEVLWEDGLTLIQAIAAAGYTDTRTPSVIAILRQSGRISVSPRDVLAGQDVPLQPGDTIEIHP